LSQPTFDIPTGAVNGVNRIFYVPVDYKSGSVQVWVNGLLHVRHGQNGWSEMGGRKIQMHEAPKSGDYLTVYYIPIV